MADDPMRILYDGLVYQYQVAGGISRYFKALISRLPDPIVPLVAAGRELGHNAPQHPRLELLCPRHRVPGPLSSRAAALYFRVLESHTQYDILHPTYYALLTRRSPRTCRRPVVVTVYDMIDEVMGAAIDPHGRQAAHKRKAISSAQAILCISENTKRDLLRFYPEVAARVWVTPLASDIDPNLAFGPEPVPARPYFLYVGSRARYKNFDALVRALSDIAASMADLTLALVGPPITPAEQALLGRLGLGQRVEHYGYVTDAHLAKLYRCSLALVYPSLYEGFGIPPLEAMACGTMAIVARTSSLPEVVGDAGLMFDPDVPHELTEIMRAVADGSLSREAWIARGQARATAFNWDKTAAATFTVYRALCP